MSLTRRETALSLISDLMGQLGLGAPNLVVGINDETISQFLRLGNSAGQQLAMDEFAWQVLSREHVITTVVSQAAYPLPNDFDGYEADASWNRTTRLPVIGSLTEVEWQMLKARLVAGTTFTMLYRVEDDQIVFYEEPTSVQTIVLPYRSRGWVRSATDANIRQDTILNDADVVLFDPQLFKAKLRHLWYEVKGFDTTKTQKSLDRILSAAKANDKPGRTLSLAPGGDYPYLGVINVPDTGYGGP